MMKNSRYIETDRQWNGSVGDSRTFIALCLTTLFLLAATESFAKSVSFTWTANPEPVEGYKLHYKKAGTASSIYDGTGAVEGASPINVGKQTTYTVTGLDDNTTYYFTLTAYNGTEESSYSTVITVPSATSTTTFTPQIIKITIP